MSSSGYIIAQQLGLYAKFFTGTTWSKDPKQAQVFETPTAAHVFYNKKGLDSSHERTIQRVEDWIEYGKEWSRT